MENFKHVFFATETLNLLLQEFSVTAEEHTLCSWPCRQFQLAGFQQLTGTRTFLCHISISVHPALQFDTSWWHQLICIQQGNKVDHGIALSSHELPPKMLLSQLSHVYHVEQE